MSALSSCLSSESEPVRAESVLLESYKSPDRPISQKELQSLQNKLYWSLGISKYLRAQHKKCGHFYLVKRNGHKARLISKESEDTDVGNCSVCWKLRQTSNDLYERARDFSDLYCEEFASKDVKLSFFNVEVERIFYTWLYGDTVKSDRKQSR
jgi:hypothetical protein